MKEYKDLFLDKDLSEIDPDIDFLIRQEEKRQKEKIILIPSESIAPKAVREALRSVFTNLYAEGYPSLRMTREEEKMFLDFESQLGFYRRYANRRFYKGCEYVDLVEVLAQKRIAQCFATREVRPEDIFVNIQPLSGAAANNVVYEAFLEPGDTIMGMSLSCGGHLTHGSEFHRSGKCYRVVSYEADMRTGRLDYDVIMKSAEEYKPKMIIAGYSSYPWAPDWEKFREIADKVGAILFADIAHPAGMVIAGVYPTPIGYADVVTFTTHKTICGPRGAVILTFDEEKAQQINNAVFPGEQGGPHTNKFVAIAVAFKIAQTEEFCNLQKNIKENARILANALKDCGLKLAYGGTDTHLLVIDLNAISSKGRFPLKGEPAARILDLCGIVTNKNTIPGDENIGQASGIRLGTPWVTQQGMGRKEMEKIGELIARVLLNIQPFRYIGRTKDLPRGKIDLSVMEEVKAEVAQLLGGEKQKLRGNVLEISGKRAQAFLQGASSGNVMKLGVGEAQESLLLDQNGSLIDKILISRLAPNEQGEDCYKVIIHSSNTKRVKAWLEGLSDGYIIFDSDDVFRKIEGPVKIRESGMSEFGGSKHSRFEVCLPKPYFIGQKGFPRSNRLSPVTPFYLRDRSDTRKGVTGLFKRVSPKKEYQWEKQEIPPRKSCLYEEHQKLGARIITFAGWEMPVWYTKIRGEHRAVRERVGLFDVSHMGVLEIQGEQAARFLDLVTTNYVPGLKIGQSHYSYILDPDGRVVDDIMVYCRAPDRYMLVTNAVNTERVKDWLEAVNSREFVIDKDDPIKEVDATVSIRDLKEESSGKDQKVDIALQGPNSLAILRGMVDDPSLNRILSRLRKFEFIETRLHGVEMIISRSGYTGEEVGFELFLHPADAVKIWDLLLIAGKDWGLKPVGLGARDSTRIEAGLPLHGHELAGKYNISPLEAGYGAFVKFHKPFFIGRKAMLENDTTRDMEIIRFQMDTQGGRMIRTDDPVVSSKGECIGFVTSCTLVEETQQGMAYIRENWTQEGTKIGIFILSRGKAVVAGESLAELRIGDKVSLCRKATILSRFPIED